MKTILSILTTFVVMFFATGVAAMGINPDVGSITVLSIASGLTAGSYFVSLAYGGDVFAMLNACGAITANIGAACAANLSPGVEDTIYLFNYDDVSGWTETSQNLVTAITMSGMALGFSYTGKLNSSVPKAELVSRQYSNLWKHTVEFRIFDWLVATKDEVDQIVNGKFLVVIINNARTHTADGDIAIEVYGREAGMYLEAGLREPNNADNAGAITLTLASRENNEEGNLPTTWFDTDYATTKALLDAAVTP